MKSTKPRPLAVATDIHPAELVACGFFAQRIQASLAPPASMLQAIVRRWGQPMTIKGIQRSIVSESLARLRAAALYPSAN